MNQLNHAHKNFINTMVPFLSESTSDTPMFEQVNNLNHRYGMAKFSRQHYFQTLNVLSHHSVDQYDIQKTLNFKKSSMNTESKMRCLHFSPALSKSVTIDLLLDSEIDINDPDRLGRTPLQEAVRFNNMALVKQFLAFEANPLIVDKQGICAISEAAYYGHYAILDCLMAATEKHSTQQRSNKIFPGNLPMALASRNGHLACVKLLHNRRAGHINGCTEKGNTPVMLSAQAGHIECTQWLLENGANPDLANFEGISTRDIVEKQRHNTDLAAIVNEY